jgi:hypothetical protein
MAGLRHRYTFKCEVGHETEKIFPPGTRIDENDETTCLECLKKGDLKTAYVIFICSMPAKGK